MGFPIEAAVRLSMKYGFSYFLNYQLYAWSNAFNRVKLALILTYEDTQPLGAFLIISPEFMLMTASVKQSAYSMVIFHTIPYLKFLLMDRLLKNLLWDSSQWTLLNVILPTHMISVLQLP